MSKLVSVITPSYGRARLLAETIRNVHEQTYRPLEHVIVTDGIPHPDWQRDIGQVIAPYRTLPGGKFDYSVRVVPLGRHWTGELRDAYAAAPMLVGQFLAAGDYQTWCADDERMTPEHVAKLVARLEEADVDFVYPFVLYYRNGEDGYTTIGTDPPRRCSLTHTLYRRELLDKCHFPINMGRESDWYLVKSWMRAGATWAMLDEMTFSHRDDKGVEGTEHWEEDLPRWARPS